MPELRVCKLMEASSGSHAEVAPNVLAATEVEFLHCATARAKPLVWVLGRDPAGNHVTVGGGTGGGAAKEDRRSHSINQV